MIITKELLKEWSACTDGFEWFLRTFPEGGELQLVLDALCDADRPSDAEWLLDNAGSTDAVLEANELIGKKHFVFAGSLKIDGNINIEGLLITGRGIEAGFGIEAGRGIKAGEGIKAGRGIKAGEDFGIFAGLKIKLSRWVFDAIVSSKQRPENLISGYWKEND